MRRLGIAAGAVGASAAAVLLILFAAPPSGPPLTYRDWVSDYPCNMFYGSTEGQPPFRYAATLTYDAARKKHVLFGGTDGTGNPLGDTWSYDRITRAWTQLHPTHAPSARRYHAATWDSARGVVVLHGGFTASTANAETWEWNGTDWTRTATTGPAARYVHGLAYDSARNVTVTAGGFIDGVVAVTDTWTYNGTSWTQRATAGYTGRFVIGGMVYDSARAQTLIYGGDLNGGCVCKDLLSVWNGTSWTEVGSQAPGNLCGQSVAFDSDRGATVVTMGVSTISTYNTKTWAWNGTTWAQDAVTGVPRLDYYYSAVAYDSEFKELHYVGGASPRATRMADWRYVTQSQAQPSRWRRSHAGDAAGPVLRENFSAAADSARKVLVVYGGASDESMETTYGDTWEWNGTSWRQTAIGTGPPARRGAGMAYDSTRGVMVINGGVTQAGTLLRETWTYNGTSWTEVSTTGPSARVFPGLAHDTARNVTVLYSGTDLTTALGDTWEWNGTAWTGPISTQHTPTARLAPTSTWYDIARGVVVVAGGDASNVRYHYSSEVSEYNGTDWRTAPPLTLARAYAEGVYDSVRHVGVLTSGVYGTDAGVTMQADYWATDTLEYAGAWTTVYPSASPPRGPTMMQGGGGFIPTLGPTFVHGTVAPCTSQAVVWEYRLPATDAGVP